MRTLPNNVEWFKTNRQSRKHQQDKNKTYYSWILRQNEAWFYKLGIKVRFFSCMFSFWISDLFGRAFKKAEQKCVDFFIHFIYSSFNLSYII